MLQVCVSASSTEGLSRTCELRDALGTTATSDDALMNRSILRATAWAERYVGQPLQAQVYQETLAAYGGRDLMVSRTPVRAVLRLFDSTATSEGAELTSTEYRLEDADAGLIGRDKGFSWTADELFSGGTFNVGLVGAILPVRPRRPWLVEYEAGFVFPEAATSNGIWSTAGGTTSTGATLPFEIEQAVLLKAREFYEGSADGVSSKRVGDLAITYRSEAEGMGEAEKLLAPWRRY